MKTIALVSVTLNAVNPMMNYLSEQTSEIKLVNYLDSFLLEKIQKDGRISDESMGRMFSMLTKACTDGADAIILTCTIFSPYVEHMSRMLSVPIICPDGAMLEMVSKQQGRKAILCTFEGTVETTKSMYQSYCKKNGVNEDVDLFSLPDAYEAARKSDFKRFNQIIRNKVIELDYKYDHIVLAQISMAPAANEIETENSKIYTSPACAYGAVQAVFGQP